MSYTTLGTQIVQIVQSDICSYSSGAIRPIYFFLSDDIWASCYSNLAAILSLYAWPKQKTEKTIDKPF
jgi:hypothetical protein